MISKSQNMLIIGKVWPEPDSSAAGSRMMQLIDLFSAEGWTITFASPAGETEYAANLKTSGINQVQIEVNSSSFDGLVRNLNPALVLFDRFSTEEKFGWRVAEQCPAAVRILDTEDLHCLREERHQAWKEKREFEKPDLISGISKREIASIYRCDLSLIISEYEMELLTDFFGVKEELLHYIPFMLDEINDADILNWPNFDSRKHFISIGNFLHEPNWNAVLFLKEEIWPLIRKQLPEIELHVYGAYANQKAGQLHNPDEGFLVKGRAENAKEVLARSRVLLAPLRFGAGIKGKLTDAMQCGTPSVTTRIGAEAMHGELDWPGIIANSPAEIADAAVILYRNKERWEKTQKNGIRVINRRYQKREPGRRLINKIAKVSANLEIHRRQNFTGQMLMHHTMASTRFMSKWIEEKNK